MADLLIKHLQKKGAEHSALSLLVNQWGFDQQLIPKALQGVGVLFPHYSRHDESHSKQILINIERLLGENIELLTATDTWLILEAAYWHDIGMIVPHGDIEQALASEDFQEYLNSIRANPQHELHNFCQSFDSSDVLQCFAGASTPLDALTQFRELMAEWFRRQHPERANKIVQSPWATVGINSPRTELIPNRLFKLLGQICRMHGATFDSLLGSNGLPFREAGLAQEDCHPRFVACLLRMGDLLDLDDNRFCPVMQRISGDRRPKISKAHEDKHAGIRRLRLDREYIEIEAECETIEGYLEAFKWFDWLKKEIQDQMANWQRIVPNRSLGLLPTLGSLAVRLNGKYQVLSEGRRPQFGIDADMAKDLLQGSNLYADEFACIRELLQNSVDATILRWWLASRSTENSAAWITPMSAEASSELSAHPIKVSLSEKTSNIPGHSRWVISIKDEGTGISRQDLVHMLNIGGSNKNQKRQSLISQMPEWLKPSGTFGIGFQSVFLVCDEVSIVSKSVFTNETLELKFFSPTRENDGLVLIQVIDTPFRAVGTEITFEINLESFASSFSLSYSDGDTIAQRFVRSLDPILDDLFPYRAGKILDRVANFAKNSLVPIDAHLKSINGKNDVHLSAELTDGEIESIWTYVKVEEHEIRLSYQVGEGYGTNQKPITLYRGQPFKTNGMTFPFIAVSIDLVSGKAGSWLNASRDSVAAKARASFSRLLISALEIVVEKRLSKDFVENFSGEKAVFSLFLKAMAQNYGEKWDRLAKTLGNEWLKIRFNSNKSYGDLFAEQEVVVAMSHKNPMPDAPDGAYYFSDYEMFYLLVNEWNETPGRTVKILSAKEASLDSGESADICYKLCRGENSSYSELALLSKLARYARNSDFNRRYILNTNDSRWKDLFVGMNFSWKARGIFSIVNESDGRVLLPYLFRERRYNKTGWIQANDTLDELCLWIRPRLKKDLSVREIREKYLELIEFLDSNMLGSEYAAVWSEARGFLSRDG